MFGFRWFVGAIKPTAIQRVVAIDITVWCVNVRQAKRAGLCTCHQQWHKTTDTGKLRANSSRAVAYAESSHCPSSPCNNHRSPSWSCSRHGLRERDKRHHGPNPHPDFTPKFHHNHRPHARTRAGTGTISSDNGAQRQARQHNVRGTHTNGSIPDDVVCVRVGVDSAETIATLIPREAAKSLV
jgi:hypothetical protein